jgi:Flp pilus assembly protein TadD
MATGDLQETLDRAVRLHREGRLGQAEAAYRAVLRQRPAHNEVRERLGVLLLQAGRSEAAAAELGQALLRGPRTPSLLANHALALHAQGRFEDAADAAAEAVEMRPRSAQLWITLGNRAKRAGRPDVAERAYHRALELEPGSSAAQVGLGNLHAARGDGAAAARAYRAALDRDPSAIRAFYHLACVPGPEGAVDGATVERFAALARSAALPARERLMVHGALGQIAERAGDGEAAFAHFAAANAAAAALSAPGPARLDAARHHAMVEAQMAAFTGRSPAAAQTAAVDGPRPVFIVGMPRSGSTLVEQVLGNHPKVVAEGELPLLPRLAAGLEGYPQAIGDLGEATCARLADRYREGLSAAARRAAVVVDKQPVNYLHLGLAARLFPDARVVHCRRDPVETCLSCFTHVMQHAGIWTHDLAGLGAIWRDQDRLMGFWAEVLPLPIFALDYEAFAADPAGQAQRLFGFLGLDWEPRFLDLSGNGRLVHTASALQVRGAIARSLAGHRHRYARHLDTLVDALGDRAPH